MSLHAYFVVLAMLLCQADAFPFGAPMSTCFTQYPKHGGSQTQISTSPFVVTFTPTSYQPGQEVTIEVTDSAGVPFKGIQIAAKRSTGNPDEIVGRFVDYPVDKLKTFNCYGGYQNMLTHSTSASVNKMTFKWKAPADNVGDIYFRSTLLRNYDIFWYDVLFNMTVDSSSAVVPSEIPIVPLGVTSKGINFEGCGDSKGCFYYPRTCSGSNCIAAATYKYRSASNDYVFELYSNNDVDYVSLGFSDDEKMGSESTMTCTGRNGKMSVQEGWNPGHHNERYINTYSSAREVAYLDGKLQCRFVLPETFKIYHVIQNKDSNNYTEMTWDLRESRYLMLAWGYTMLESDVINSHEDMPAITSSKVDLKEKVISYSSTFHIMVKAHASVMMAAWILLTGIITVVSRHYRDWLPKTKWCGTKVWFQIHRTLAVLVALLTFSGIILIFVHYGAGIREHSKPHAYVGIAVTACVGLQIIAGMLRPDGDHKMRPVFNRVHWFMGHASHILAAVTMFLAFDISYINKDMKQFGFIVLSVWVVVQLLWHLVFEVIRHNNAGSGKSDNYAIDEGKKAKPVDQERTTNCTANSCLLVVYTLCLIGLFVAGLFTFLLY